MHRYQILNTKTSPISFGEEFSNVCSEESSSSRIPIYYQLYLTNVKSNLIVNGEKWGDWIILGGHWTIENEGVELGDQKIIKLGHFLFVIVGQSLTRD